MTHTTQYESVVRQLAESFPHVPLDDVWTAVITARGNRVDASARLLTYEQPVAPVLGAMESLVVRSSC